MHRKIVRIGISIIVCLTGISSLLPCDRYNKRQTALLIPRNPWTDAMYPPYDGGWGFPRSVDVNSYDAECFPWPSANGKYLLFASINFNGPPRPGHQPGENWDIYISEWDSLNRCWGEAYNLGPNINASTHERAPCCTPNCDTLYFDRDDDIYMSTWDGADWTTPVALPDPVNTHFLERHPAISADRQRLYFTSNRPDGHGGRDIWVARWNGAAWGSVHNLGSPINTPNEETRPFESYDRQRFYFSNNHGQPRPGISYGGASDIYISTFADTGWGPVHLVAAPVNSDLCACSPRENFDGSELWIGSEAYEGSIGDEDIWVARKGISVPPRNISGYGNWLKTGELKNAIYVYDLKEDGQGTIYAATACSDSVPAGAVFKTTDGGDTWIKCGYLPDAMIVYSLLVEGNVVFAGTYPYGDVFRSTDGGTTWNNTADIQGITAARSLTRLTSGDILVGTSPYDVNNCNRIFRTTDEGASWIQAAVLLHINPCKFLVQTRQGDLFAGGWGIDSGVTIHRSRDDGVSWDTLVVIDQMECEWSSDRLIEAQDGTLYLTGWTPSHGVGRGGGYVYRSSDRGDTWESCTKIIRQDGVHSGRIYTILEEPDGTIYVGMQPAYDDVVYSTTDGGDEWKSTGGLDGAFECLCLLRSADGYLYAGTTPNGDVFRYVPESTQVHSRFPAGLSRCTLFQNTPNPFNPETTIGFEISFSERVTIEVYDVLGRHVNTLVDEPFDAGTHQIRFAAVDHNGAELASGIYFYRMTAGDFTSVKKCMVIE